MSRVNAVSIGASPETGRGRVPYSTVSDFGAGDNKRILRFVEELPAGRTLVTAFLTAKAHGADVDASALFKLEISTSSSAAGVITQIANGVGAVAFELLPAHTQLAGIIAGAQFDMELLDDQGHVYTIDRGMLQPTIPRVNTDQPHTSPAWIVRSTSAEIPTGQTRRIAEELLDDFFARDDYTLTRTVWIPAGRTLSSLTFYAFTNPGDLAGVALVTAAATVTDNGSGTGIAAVTIAISEGQTNQLRDPKAWRAVATLDDGKKYTCACGTIWAQGDVTDASQASIATLSFDPPSISVPEGLTANSTVRAYSAGGAELVGRSITGVVSSDATSATASPSSGVSPLTVTVTGVLDGTDCTVAAHAGAIAATPLDVAVAPAGVYGILSPDPILWLKPESIAGTAVDGLTVATWPDSSPHGWDMTAMVSNGAGTDPKWDAAEGALRFFQPDGNAYENAAFNDFASATEYTLFVVKKSAASGGCVMSTSSSDWWEGYQASSHYRTDLGGFGFESHYDFVDDLASHVHETRYDGGLSGSARLLQYMDSALQTVSQFSIPSGFNSGGGMCIGHGSGLGFFNGWIKEVLLFPARLTDAECDSVAAALATKYGI